MYTYKWYEARQNTCFWWSICLTKYKKACIQRQTKYLLHLFEVEAWSLYIVRPERISSKNYPNNHHHHHRGLCTLWKDSYWFTHIVSRHQSHPQHHHRWHQRSTRVTFSTSRREWEFLLFNLAHRDETRIFWHLISGFETRSRKILLQSRSTRRERDLLFSFSGFEMRTRIFLIWSQFSRQEREF